jgi:adenylate kinase family enzyme
MPKTIHFEGIPGSGKSTASERLTGILQSREIDAAWWREESAAHPIMPKERRALSRDGNFPEVCLNAWRSFLDSRPQAVAVLDGYAFQNTVRFLFEQQVNRDQIANYFQNWQALAPETLITYLVVNDPVKHCEVVLRERGSDWTQKLFAWIERTPMGIASNLHGKSGFVRFWSIYQELCLELLESAFIQVEMIEARSWNDDTLENLAMRCGLFP